MNVLYLIVARGGSKSIPRKNLARIAGLSLIGYKARAARRSRSCARLILSSDCAEIQDEARDHGVEVPFTRPSELASDTAQTVDVIRHAMDWIEANDSNRYGAVMLLEPSSPFSTAADFDASVEMMARTNASVVVGMREMEVNSMFTGPIEGDGGISPIVRSIASRRALARQQVPQEYTMNGCLYLIGWEHFRRTGAIYSDPDSTYGYVMDRMRSIEIDEPIDLDWARFLAATGKLDLSLWLDPAEICRSGHTGSGIAA